VPRDHAAVELALPPVHPPAWQLVACLERPDVLLAVTSSLEVGDVKMRILEIVALCAGRLRFEHRDFFL
jgi:hypothetical protein